MAKNTGGNMKRTVYKYIRDGVKSNYVYKDCCEVCGTAEDLELHHPTTLSLLFDQWCSSRDVDLTDKDQVMEIRQDFYKDHWEEVVTDVLTLCNKHHKALHKIYGAQPPLSTAEKQKQWVNRLRDRTSDTEVQPTSREGFGKFIPKRVPKFSEFCK
jgi:hypothetical protein